MGKKVTGYSFKVNPAYTDVDYKKMDELREYFENKYKVTIYFPILLEGRNRHRTEIISIPKRDLDLLDEVLEVFLNHHYCTSGMGRILEEDSDKK